jgi:CRP/FNR family cyclic AMP-dependent transcriptional regulator
MKTDTNTITAHEPEVIEARSPLIRKMAGHPFLKGMKPEHLQTLAACALEVEFKPGERIFREGELANRFYLIERGLVHVESEVQEHGPLLLQTIGPGDVLGWSWLFPPCYWHFDARAVSPVKAIFFYGTRLREQCEEDHDLGYQLMNRMAAVVIKRLQAARRYLVELAERGRI